MNSTYVVKGFIPRFISIFIISSISIFFGFFYFIKNETLLVPSLSIMFGFLLLLFFSLFLLFYEISINEKEIVIHYVFREKRISIYRIINAKYECNKLELLLDNKKRIIAILKTDIPENDIIWMNSIYKNNIK